VRQTEGTVAGWEAELWRDLEAADGLGSAVAEAVVGDVAVAAAAEDDEAEDAVAVAAAAAAVGQAAAVEEVAADGMQGGGAIGSSKAVADDGHQAAVGRKVSI
jgi:hypothetical protein